MAPTLSGRLRVVGSILLGLGLVTCGQDAPPSGEAAVSTVADAGLCAEHGVLDSVCAQCNPRLAAVFQSKGDWCAEHGQAESFCPICRPEAGGRPGVALTPSDGAPADGTRVSVVSYGRGREEVLSREPDCQMTRRYRGDILGFNCDVTFGSSGAPVFVRENGRLRILSVISSGAASGESYGPSLPTLVSELSGLLMRAESRPKVTAGAKRVIVGGGREASGARFVRP